MNLIKGEDDPQLTQRLKRKTISRVLVVALIPSCPPTISTVGPSYNNFQVDSFKLMELLGSEKVDPADVKLIKKKLFGYSTFWVTKEEPFEDLGEGILFLGNLRGKREEVFSKLQNQLAELMGDKYNLFMVDPVSVLVCCVKRFQNKDQQHYGNIIASQNFHQRLPLEVVKYFTDPNVIEPPDMQLLFPFVELCPGIWCPGGSAILREVGHFLAAFPKKVKLSIPFFIPNITLGNFGAITQVKSILPDRKTKVDITLAGPFAGATLSFSMFAVGLLLSSNPNAAVDLVQVPSMLFQEQCIQPQFGSILLCGLTTSAFNMLPVGCLDGGRAIYTREADGLISKRHSLVASVHRDLILQGIGELSKAFLDKKARWTFVTSLGSVCVDMSETVLTVAIFLVVLTLLPVWDKLAEELGIALID
ncbi:unnamed protein product [Camellia sinensis]